MLWSAEEMLDGQHQREDNPANARTAHKGLMQKRLEEDFCWIVPRVSPTTQSVKGLNRTELVLPVTRRIWHHALTVCGYFVRSFNCISFFKFSRQLSVFFILFLRSYLCLLVRSTIHLSVKVSFSPDITPRGWLGSNHQWTNFLCLCLLWFACSSSFVDHNTGIVFFFSGLC